MAISRSRAPKRNTITNRSSGTSRPAPNIADMKFFFPDSQDQVDPNFDMITEEHAVHRIRQRDDTYAHETLTARPFDGLLLAKPIVDGRGGGSGSHYTTGARQRLYREGVHEFFRLNGSHKDVLTMGDCGAFTYAREEDVPYKVDEVIDFYEGCGFDRGVAPDHIIFGFAREGEVFEPDVLKEFKRRFKITQKNAAEFLERHSARHCNFEPMAAAHGWDADSYADAVTKLIALGYKRIAMGGMVPLRTPDIISTLKVVKGVLKKDTELHLLGVTRVKEMPLFMGYGVTSFDSTSPFFQAFKDADDNYYLNDETFVAIKIPQVDGNATMKKLIGAGQVNQNEALKREQYALDMIRKYAKRKAKLEPTLEAILDYEALMPSKRDRRADYTRTLETRPWDSCNCGICDKVGVEVIIFRGSERNKRRGFHNLAVFRDRMDSLEMAATKGKKR